MDAMMTGCLSGLRFGEMQAFKNMAVIPLFASANGSPDYVMLKEALDRKLIAITEVSEAGSVPDLKVTNDSERFVLMLDGEEVIGAKQNRVLNTSILVGQKSELTIPVSCTEQGRWGYTSSDFSYSDSAMSYMARSRKSRSVSRAYDMGHGARSDQGQVWAEIANLHEDVGTSSRTGAMRDAYTARSNDLDSYLEAFRFVSGQRGCLGLLNGAVMGMDLLSREDAYRAVHGQLIKSYAMDALRRGNGKAEAPSAQKAEAFLDMARQCRERRFESPGAGQDYRFEGSQVIGSALVYEDHAIHTALFRTDTPEEDVRMSAYLQRRRFRNRGRS